MSHVHLRSCTRNSTTRRRWVLLHASRRGDILQVCSADEHACHGRRRCAPERLPCRPLRSGSCGEERLGPLGLVPPGPAAAAAAPPAAALLPRGCQLPRVGFIQLMRGEMDNRALLGPDVGPASALPNRCGRGAAGSALPAAALLGPCEGPGSTDTGSGPAAPSASLFAPSCNCCCCGRTQLGRRRFRLPLTAPLPRWWAGLAVAAFAAPGALRVRSSPPTSSRPSSNALLPLVAPSLQRLRLPLLTLLSLSDEPLGLLPPRAPSTLQSGGGGRCVEQA